MSESDGKRCECHECTQARYRGSFQHQLDQAFRPTPSAEAQLAAKDAVIAGLAGALTDVFKLLDSGVLVRNTSEDALPGWTLQALELTMTLQRAKAALTLAADATKEAR